MLDPTPDGAVNQLRRLDEELETILTSFDTSYAWNYGNVKDGLRDLYEKAKRDQWNGTTQLASSAWSSDNESISFEVAEFGLVHLAVYSVTGTQLATLIQKELAPGRYQVSWDGRDGVGDTVPSGVYVYKLVAPGYVDTRKMVLLK